MNKKLIKFLLSTVMVVAVLSLGFRGTDDKNKLNKPTINDNYNYIAINQILMYVSNNGDGSHDPKTAAGGFYWPGGINATKSAVFQDGFIYGSKIGNDIRVNGNTHRQGLQAGKILFGAKADDPTLPKYRVYKIKKDWKNITDPTLKAKYEKDWNEWPVDDGAPWIDINKDGKYDPNVDMPNIVGDEMLWYVANDMDAARTTYTYGTKPQGLEFQTTIFGFNRTGPLGNMLFKKYLFINKGTYILDEMIIGYWSDTDLGFAEDDYSGCDTVLKLGYTYNATNTDAIYGTPCPAIGYVFFQGPKIKYDITNPIIVEKNLPDSALFQGKWYKGQTNLPMTAYTFYINGNMSYQDPDQGLPAGSAQFYNYLSGKVWNGNPFIDPNTNQIVKYVLSGDPVAKKGWYEGLGFPGGPVPGDRRHIMASGPFRMAPGDTQEVVVGIVIAQGGDNLGSVTELKKSARLAQTAFDVNFNLPPAPPAPILHLLPGNESVTLWWETNAEKYAVQNTIIDPTAPDKFYRFQGYRVWQFKDAVGSNPQLLATFDIKDSVLEVREIMDINGVTVTAPIFKCPNEGLSRSFTITTNKYTNGQFYNGTPYYFGITSFGVNKYSLPNSPEYLESTAIPLEVRPTTLKVDQTNTNDVGSTIRGQKIAGSGHGNVYFKVVDPTALTGDLYNVVFSGSGSTLSYSLLKPIKLNNPTRDSILVLLSNMKDFGSDSTGKIIIDGFNVYVQNVGQDSITALPAGFSSGFKEVVEISKSGTGGASDTLTSPKNVLNSFNSTTKWKIYGNGRDGKGLTGDQRINLNWGNSAGQDDYEIRFTNNGSNYFAGFGGINPAVGNSPKGKLTVPFEIWNVGKIPSINIVNKILPSVDTAKRLVVKIIDKIIRDTNWTRNDTTLAYEEITPYQPLVYPEPFPATSGTSQATLHKFGFLTIVGEKPEPGTIIRLITWKPLTNVDVFSIKTEMSNLNDKEAAKSRLNQISVYPNPYFGANSLERDKYQRFVRFTNLPTSVNVKIFNLAGVFITEIKKDNSSPWLDWNLRTIDGLPIASGVYIAYLDMPGIGTKIMKIAVIMETQYIDRL